MSVFWDKRFLDNPVPVAVILAVDLALSQTIQEEEAKKPTFNTMISENGATKYISRAVREENQHRPIWNYVKN